MSDRVFLSGTLHCTTDEQIEVVDRLLPQHVRLTTAEPGCLVFDVLPSGEPGVWTVSETFADSDSFRAHQERASDSEWGRQTQGIERRYEVSGLDDGSPAPGGYPIR